MVKRRKISSPASKNDTKVVAIVLGLFVAAIILFFIFSKPKESHKQKIPAKPVKVAVPVKKAKSVKPKYTPSPVAPGPYANIPGSGGKIAIIIDDWGQTTSNCKYLKEIPQPLAVAILPDLQHTRDVAKCAKLYRKLAMLHLPLEALYNSDVYPPNYIIKTSMTPSLVSKIVDEDLAQMPSIEGVNNHMGSKATANKTLMRHIFKKLKKKGLFFVDSVTSQNSISAALAEEMGLAFGKRDVFLDNINTREEIIKQLVVLAQKARRKGYAVAIGHDRRLTMQVLKEQLPLLERQGFKIVSIKELLKNR